MEEQKNKWLYITLEILLGALGAFFSAILFSVSGVKDVAGQLDVYYFKFFSLVYLGIILGVGLGGFIYTSYIRQPLNVVRGMLYGIVGLFVFVWVDLALRLFISNDVPYVLRAWILPILIPLLGTVIGFNIRIDKPFTLFHLNNHPDEFHILNGDSLLEQLHQFNKDKIVFRECLIDGPVKSTSLNAFMRERAIFFEEVFCANKDDYLKNVAGEIEKISRIPKGSIVNLWFEQDLFCQVNMWFIVNLLKEFSRNCTLYLVLPIKDSWHGFGVLSLEELKASYANRLALNTLDKRHIVKLWESYRENNWSELKRNASPLKRKMEHIEDVVQAHIDRFPENGPGRPEKTLKMVMAESENKDFASIFKKFNAQEGIYGFGDIQVKRMLEKMKHIIKD
ncbi:DUF1835 domain-containing protein [Saccharicrinis sp. 156]|uniref:DUF1835 domain-containing protein n=1 Tax=Saccharicrinis sp. 156 TaxID=3417574 RepID=UPI003D33E2B0